MIITSSSQKVFYRENFRRYFETQEPDCMVYLYNIVSMLIPTKEGSDRLRKTLGDETLQRILDNLRKFQSHYSYASQIRKIITEIKAKQSEDRENTILTLQRKELRLICEQMPLIREDIITAFFILVNDSDLRNIVEPTTDRSQALRPYIPNIQGDRT